MLHVTNRYPSGGAMEMPVTGANGAMDVNIINGGVGDIEESTPTPSSPHIHTLAENSPFIHIEIDSDTAGNWLIEFSDDDQDTFTAANPIIESHDGVNSIVENLRNLINGLTDIRLTPIETGTHAVKTVCTNIEFVGNTNICVNDMANADNNPLFVSDGVYTPFLIESATTTEKLITSVGWIQVNGDGGTLGNVKIYNGGIADEKLYDATPIAGETLLRQCRLSNSKLTIVTAAATKLNGGLI
jgi:hypothetical protein